MKRCSPKDMKKNLEIVDILQKSGIDFVPVPAIDAEHKKSLIIQSDQIYSRMTAIIEKESK